MKVVSTLTAGTLGAMVLQENIQPVNADCPKVACLTAVAFGIGGAVLTYKPMFDMRNQWISLSDSAFKTIRHVTDRLVLNDEPLIQSANKNLEVLGESLDGLIEVYGNTSMADLVEQFAPGSSQFPIRVNDKMSGRYLCDRDLADRLIDDINTPTKEAFGNITRSIFGVFRTIFDGAFQTFKPEMCNLVQAQGTLLYAENATDRLVNEFAMGGKQGFVNLVERVNQDGSQLSSVVENVLDAARGSVKSLEVGLDSFAGIDIKIKNLIQELDSLSTLSLEGSRFYVLALAFAAAQGVSFGGFGANLVLGLQEGKDVLAQGVAYGEMMKNAPHAIQLVSSSLMGLIAGIVTHQTQIKPLERTLNSVQANFNALISDEQLSELQLALTELDTALAKLVDFVDAVFEWEGEGVWSEIRQLESLTVDFNGSSPLQDICNVETNEYAQDKDLSIKLLCDLMSSLLNVLEGQNLSERLSNDFLQSVLKTTLDSVEGLASHVSNEANLNVTSLRYAVTDLSALALQLATGSRMAIEEMTNAKAQANDSIDHIQSGVSWYIPLMVAFLAVGAVNQFLLVGRSLMASQERQPAANDDEEPNVLSRSVETSSARSDEAAIVT